MVMIPATVVRFLCQIVVVVDDVWGRKIFMIWSEDFLVQIRFLQPSMDKLSRLIYQYFMSVNTTQHIFSINMQSLFSYPLTFCASASST